MPNQVYNSFKRDIMNGSIDLDIDTINIMLVTSAYVPNIDTHTKRSDVTNEVAAGGGYATGGQVLAGKVVSVDNAGDKGAFDAADAVWAAATITAKGAVVYKSTGVAANDNLICYIDFVTDKTSTAGDFTVIFNAAGILTLT